MLDSCGCSGVLVDWCSSSDSAGGKATPLELVTQGGSSVCSLVIYKPVARRNILGPYGSPYLHATLGYGAALAPLLSFEGALDLYENISMDIGLVSTRHYLDSSYQASISQVLASI